MVSTAQQKLIRKLRQKKHRYREKMFVAEGEKVIRDLLASGMQARLIISSRPLENLEAVEADEKLISALSSLATADGTLAVFPFPEIPKPAEDKVLILDDIRDPGNLGTIIRTADWYGFGTIYCVTGSVDCYNAKTVQSTMGSIARVAVHYASADEILAKTGTHRLLLADMQGSSIYEQNLKRDDKLALILGSESHGPSEFWKNYAEAITIPRHSSSPIDSLNVAISAGIMMDRLSGAGR